MSKTLQEMLHYAEEQAETFDNEENIDHMIVCYHRSTSSTVHTLLDGSQLPPDSNLWKCLRQEEQFFCSSPNKRPRSDEGCVETKERMDDDPSSMVTDNEEETTAENSPPQHTADNVVSNQQEEKPVVETLVGNQEEKPVVETQLSKIPVQDSSSSSNINSSNNNNSSSSSSSSSSSNNNSSSSSSSTTTSNNKRPAAADAFKLLMKGAHTNAAHNKPFVMHFNLILTTDKKLHVEILLQKTQGGSVVGSGGHGCDTGDNAAIRGHSQPWAWTADSKLHGFSFLMGPTGSEPGLGLGPGQGIEDVILRVNTNIAPATTSSSSTAEQRPLSIHPSLLKSMLQKAVRTRSHDSAGRLSLALARISMPDLLRRLPVIMLEDGVLHPGLPLLVWCMVAQSKAYPLPSFLLAMAVGVITEVAEVQCKDSRAFLQLPPIITTTAAPTTAASTNDDSTTNFKPLPDNINPQSIPIPTHAPTLSDPHTGYSPSSVPSPCLLDLRAAPVGAARTTILAMLLRASFGGMQCDIVMLREYAYLWSRRMFGDLGVVSSGPTPTAQHGHGHGASSSGSHSNNNSNGTGNNNNNGNIENVSSSSGANRIDNNSSISISNSNSDSNNSGIDVTTSSCVLSLLDSGFLDSLLKPTSVHCNSNNNNNNNNHNNHIINDNTGNDNTFNNYNSCDPASTTSSSASFSERRLRLGSEENVWCRNVVNTFSFNHISPSPCVRQSLTTFVTTTLSHAQPPTPSSPSGPLTWCVAEPLSLNQPSLALMPDDLLATGIDFHCDNELVRHVLTGCRGKLWAFLTSPTRTATTGSTIIIPPRLLQPTTPGPGPDLALALEAGRDEFLIDLIKTCIWVFRSGNNTHKLWPDLLQMKDSCDDNSGNSNNGSSEEKEGTAESSSSSNGKGHTTPIASSSSSSGNDRVSMLVVISRGLSDAIAKEPLEQKRRLAGVWGIVCPLVSAYCRVKKTELEARLRGSRPPQGS